MTLNITLVARWGVYQSADFRLVSDVGGTWTPQSDSAQKQVVLQYDRWTGVLAYTGVAATGRHDTARWLGQVLVHDPPDRSFENVLGALKREGDQWISRIPPKWRRHTFTLAGFGADGKPRVGWVSTALRSGRDPIEPASKEFVTSWHRPKGPQVFFAGDTRAVTSGDRARLLEALRKADHGATRTILADVNAAVARRSNGTVSEHCIAAHLLPDGTGEAQVFGDLAQEFIPSLIVHGQDFGAVVAQAITDAGHSRPHRLVGVTWTSSDAGSAMLGAFRELK